MLSNMDLERLIAEKRLEIEKEKMFLGLSPPPPQPELLQIEDVSQQEDITADNPKKKVNFAPNRVLCENNAPTAEEKKETVSKRTEDLEENIPPDLDRYIRRYLGLPVMLKAGEFSPNNPLTRGERTSGDALLGLGEYERRRNTLRRMRQQQYREYLDQQAKKKQEAKEQSERERREREEKEKEREERERELEREREGQLERERQERERERRLVEQERHSPERRRVSVTYGSYNGTNKVDTAVQVDSRSAPLSVAVQTDETDIFRLGSPTKCQLTQAERELSPHTVLEDSRRAAGRRRSYGDFDERPVAMASKTSDKMCSSLRHSYMPSIFDADAIHLRNLQAEKEAAARRQFYQQELRNQIMEQQRIKEERKTREKMLEQAEMRRLEEQLRMLRVAQDKEVGKQQQMDSLLKEQTIQYDKKRIELQKEIDTERKILRAPLQHAAQSRNINTSKSETDKLPSYYSKIEKERKPYSTNIPDDSIFSPNYDVDSYLRRNLNFKDRYKNDYDIESIGQYENVKNVERVLIHEQPKPKSFDPNPIPKERKIQNSVDTLPIPVLRHSPVLQSDKVENNPNLSDAMRKIDDKWKVPVVQKNILKSVPDIDGKNVSILTQLGSIRRQLQLEQLKLDRMSKDED